MDYSRLFEYRPFEFWDTDPNIELCYNLAQKKLQKKYPDKILFASDYFGISIIDMKREPCFETTSYTTGRMGKAGPLAMRNELTKEVSILTICSKD